MDLRLAMLEAVSLYLLHNVSKLNQCRKLSCGTVVCKLFSSYQGYPNYRWDLIRKSVNQCWKEMAASPTERSWCVLEFALRNNFVAVQRAWGAHRMHLRSL
jgi:hypothetical protein